MLELLKNSMRATVEWHGVDGDFPPIKIVIADGSDNEDVVIKVSDEGMWCSEWIMTLIMTLPTHVVALLPIIHFRWRNSSK